MNKKIIVVLAALLIAGIAAAQGVADIAEAMKDGNDIKLCLTSEYCVFVEIRPEKQADFDTYMLAKGSCEDGSHGFATYEEWRAGSESCVLDMEGYWAVKGIACTMTTDEWVWDTETHTCIEVKLAK